MDAQDRWDAKRHGFRLVRSGRWDTTLLLLKFSTDRGYPGSGHCQAGSLTGAVAS